MVSSAAATTKATPSIARSVSRRGSLETKVTGQTKRTADGEAERGSGVRGGTHMRFPRAGERIQRGRGMEKGTSAPSS